MAMFQPDINAQTATSLRDIVGGGTAMQYISEQNDMRRRMNPINENLSLADLEKAQLANAQSRVINPLEAQVKGAQAREANSKDDPYFQQIRQGELSDVRTKLGTEKSGIALKNTKNEVEQRQMLGDEITKIAAWMAESVPPNEYGAALQQFAAKIPGMDKRPEFQALLRQNPEKILAFMQKMGDTLRAANPALRNAAEISREDNVSREKVGAGHDAATRFAAETSAAAKKKDSVTELQNALAKGNYTAGEMLAQIYREAGMPKEADFYAKQAKIIKDQQIAKAQAGATVGDNTKREIMGMPATGAAGNFMTTPGGVKYNILPSE